LEKENLTDTVVGVFNNYGWDDVKYWANSLVASGFEGRKVAIAYQVMDEVVLKLQRIGFEVHRKDIFDVGDRFNIVVRRFYDLWDVCSQMEHEPGDRLITTDVGDVVFQRNPSEYLEMCTSPDFLLASGEGIRYKDEPWSHRNMIRSFGEEEFDKMAHYEICCAGVIVGAHDTVVRLAQDVYMLCQDRPQFVEGGGGPDQAAYNILIRGKYRNKMIFANHGDWWAAQMGTTLHAVKAGMGDIGWSYAQAEDKEARLAEIEKLMLYRQPIIHETGVVYNADNSDPYCIVHQYNRVPHLRMKIRNETIASDMDHLYIKIG